MSDEAKKGKQVVIDEIKGKLNIAKYLYGEGELLNTKRHYYFYPIDKSIRRKMLNKIKPFPKDSDNYRLNQEWVIKPTMG